MPPAPLEVRFVGHATLLLETGAARILTDPFLRDRLGPLERHGARPDPASLGPIDVVLVSHGHPDHLDLASLAALTGHPTVVVPRGLGAHLGRAVTGRVIEVAAGEVLALDGVTIAGVPARHWISPGAPRAEPLGFVVDVGQRIYFAGDTGAYPGLARWVGRVDLALLPVWTWGPHLGPGHLGPRSAAEVFAALGARAAIPIHWGTLYPRGLHRAWRRPLDTPGERFASHAHRLAPRAIVQVLRPGERAVLRAAPLPRDVP